MNETSLAQDRAALSERSGCMCEICGSSRATNWHHRKNRSQGGNDGLANAMHLCGSGTTGCHGWVTEHPEQAAENGWCLKSYQDPEQVAVLVRGQLMLLRDDCTVEWVF